MKYNTYLAIEVFYRAKPEPDTPLFERLTKLLRLQPNQADKILEVHSIEVINNQLYDIHTKATDSKVKKICSYTAKIFNL